MTKSKILIVDDDPKNLKILRIRLESDYELRKASSGEEALEILREFRPGVILLDIMMPGIDGYETTRCIRKNAANMAIKIILVSGRAMTDDKLEGYKSGADDYITKPFDGAELKAKVQTFIRLHDLECELKQVNLSLEEQVQKRSEQLLVAERQAFVGRHACDIVHNLKSPLAILKMHLAMVSDQFGEHASLGKMDRAIDRMLVTVKDILLSSGEVKTVIEAVDFNNVVREELELLKLDSFNKLKVSHEVALDGKRPVFASSSHLHQIVGNLIKNAFEALYGRVDGKVLVKTEDIGDHVLLTVSDNGPGIKPENLLKIFDPLFTTKTGENGGPIGNGLGLAYCKKMIESYGGEIRVESLPGAGTKFFLKVPVSFLADTASKEKP